MKREPGLSEKSIKVLGHIADGHSYAQIVDGHDGITYHDIFHAAEEALRLNSSPKDYQARLAQIKSRYPRAYEPWTSVDDAELAAMYKAGHRLQAIAERFQRQPSAIRSRLTKLNFPPSNDLP
ncbi:MAG TPA: hypothetical protein VMV10_15215 [Pirellulales bacterium]|nr:hypothetical protein [Pirellulales bacterium]